MISKLANLQNKRCAKKKVKKKYNLKKKPKKNIFLNFFIFSCKFLHVVLINEIKFLYKDPRFLDNKKKPFFVLRKTV